MDLFIIDCEGVKGMNKKQGGFTLIELIMVIVILGILAATALPKFVDMGSDARAAVIRGVEGSMRGANSLIYAKAAAAGALGAGPTNVTINGAAVSVEYGYAASVAELVKVMDLSPAADFDSTTVVTEIQHANATVAANCKVAYAKATAAATPTYTATTSGC